jgi:anti-sigma factor RsiW
MTTCETIRPQLVELAYDELPSNVMAQVNDHLRACPACREHLATLTAGRAALTSLDPVVPGRLNPATIMARAQSHELQQRTTLRRRVSTLVACAAAVLVLFTLGVRVEIDRQHVALRWGRPTSETASPIVQQLVIPASSQDTYGQLRKRLEPNTLASHLAPSTTTTRQSSGVESSYLRLRSQLGEL